jgi:hypothetical protein
MFKTQGEEFMRSWIISANYRDRSSPYKWLVRRSDQQPQEAVAYKTVRAKGVIFCPSTAYESGFGCSVVAFAHEVVTEGPEHTIKLKFTGPSGGNLFVDETGKAHEEVAELFLGNEGEITAVPMS